eukprot:gene13693-16134_t
MKICGLARSFSSIGRSHQLTNIALRSSAIPQHHGYTSLMKESTRQYSTHSTDVEKKTTILDVKKKFKQGVAISMVTAYDYCSAKEVDRAGIDLILVGDSLGMVMLGDKSTTNVTMDQMIHHCKAVMKGSKRAFVVGDMPFGSFETSPRDAVINAFRLMKEGGVDAIKLEGGAKHKETIRAIVNAGIPVMGHIGLTPQSVSALGGFRLQGKTSAEAMTIYEDAIALQEAGCFSMVIEMVPEIVATTITKMLKIPTIGIGAGVGTSGQVLVYHDMLGLYSDFLPKFCKQYASLSGTINEGLTSFKKEIEERKFPSPSHSGSSDSQSAIKLEAEKSTEMVHQHKKPKIVVIGAGAMGSFFSAKLAAKDQAEASLTASKMVGGNPNAIVLTLQNGVGNREEIEQTIASKGYTNKVWQGVTSNGAVMAGAGSVRHTGTGLTYLASPTMNGVTAESPEEYLTLESLGAILNDAGVKSELSYDVDALVWGKVVVNAAINPLSAVLGVPNGYLVNDEYSKTLMRKIIGEGMNVCRAKGIKLPYGDDTEEGFRYVANIAERTSSNYSSMLVDVIRGQPTEINTINGVIVREGERLDVNVEYNKMIMEMVLSCQPKSIKSDTISIQ